jgi:hypothetical protein
MNVFCVCGGTHQLALHGVEVEVAEAVLLVLLQGVALEEQHHGLQDLGGDAPLLAVVVVVAGREQNVVDQVIDVQHDAPCALPLPQVVGDVPLDQLHHQPAGAASM